MNIVHGKMTEAEKKAEEMRIKDAEMLERRKKKFDAARFAHIENTNKIHGQPKPPKQAPEQPKAPDEKQESKRKGWRIFKKKNKDTTTDTALIKESTNPTVPPAKSPPPIAARSVKPANIRQEMSPGWAAVAKQNERPQPNVGHSSDLNYPRPESSSTPTARVPPTAASKNSPTPPAPEPPKYKTVGYGTTGGKKSTETSGSSNSNSSISGTIAAFQAGAPKPKTGNPRQMKQLEAVTSTSESMDARGNITRTITRTITEPNGETRTETEVIEKPAKR